jgi:hypothetical protein
LKNEQVLVCILVLEVKLYQLKDSLDDFNSSLLGYKY